MPTLDLEAEYDNRARVPDHPEVQGRLAKASEAWRKEASVELDKTYGKAPRHRFDIYRPRGADKNSPIAVYIHGGYWQRGDKKDSGFVARELNKQGITVALPSYTLCPETTVMQIVAEMRQFLSTLWDLTKQRPVVVGHSAGGHLAAAMVATDWSRIGGVPPDLVRAGYAISGVFDVAPLVPTSLNEALKLDDKSAREVSPLLWPAPPKDRTLVAAVGGDESQEFIRQSLDIAATWSRAGVKAECVVVPSTNHFTIIEELNKPESAMVARIAGLARWCATPVKGA